MELLVGMMTRHEHLLAREKEFNKEIERIDGDIDEIVDGLITDDQAKKMQAF